MNSISYHEDIFEKCYVNVGPLHPKRKTDWFTAISSFISVFHMLNIAEVSCFFGKAN